MKMTNSSSSAIAIHRGSVSHGLRRGRRRHAAERVLCNFVTCQRHDTGEEVSLSLGAGLSMLVVGCPGLRLKGLVTCQRHKTR